MSEETRRHDRLFGLFLLGLVLVNPPLLMLFGGGWTLFGLPLLYLYVFAVWLSIIAAIACLVERRRRHEDT
jgi:hypothetical protein